MPGERMRSRALTLVIAGLALFLGVLLGQQDAGGSSASAQESPSVFYGFTSRYPDGMLPSKVRAQVGDTVCGTAPVLEFSEVSGFYTLTVASAAEKAGCGEDGVSVQFFLLVGDIDPGEPVAQALWERGVHRLDLLFDSAAQEQGAFVGELPAGPGGAQMRWVGPSDVAIEDAVATIPREVVAIYRWNVATQQWDAYVVGAPAAAQTYTRVDADDIVFVRVK